MKLAISNIAWAPEDARAAYGLMRQAGFAGLEIAPGLAFAGEDDRVAPGEGAVRAFKADLAEFGLVPVSMQSLLFGVTGAQLFGTAEEQAALEHGLVRAIRLAERLGIANLVFGSPGNRSYPDGMPLVAAWAHAAALFHRLGDVAQAAGTTLAVEPNPAAYGTNFLNTVAETADFVVRVDHPAISLNFDMGALHMNGEIGEAQALYARARGKVSHIHISEPQLAPAPADAGVLATMATGVLAQGYGGWFSIEMRAPAGDTLATIASSLERTAQALTKATSAARSMAGA